MLRKGQAVNRLPIIIILLSLALAGCVRPGSADVTPADAGAQAGIKPEVTFTATPSSIGPGRYAQLSWDVKYADSVSIDQGIGTVEAGGKKYVRPTRTTIYTLTAKNGSAQTISPITVTFTMEGYTGILPPSDNWSGTSATTPWWLAPQQRGPLTIESLQDIIPPGAVRGGSAGGLQAVFFAIPNPVKQKQLTRLYWITLNAGRVDLLDEYNEFIKRDTEKSGSYFIALPATTTYKLRVTGATDSFDLLYTIIVE